MNNPSVSINDLFADVRESFIKYEHKQRLEKERRRQLKKEKAAAMGRRITPADPSARPLFGSQLNPQRNDDDKNANTKTLSQPAAAASSDSSNITADDVHSSMQKRVSLSDDKPSSPTPPPKRTMAESILAMLSAHHNDGNDSSSSSSSTTSTQDTATSAQPTTMSVSEYYDEYDIPPCEQRRREEAEAALRLKSEQLLQEQKRQRQLKPLVFAKPSFKLPSSMDKNKEEGEDQQQQGKKRKASSPPSSSNTTNPIPTQYWNHPRMINGGGAHVYTTSSAAALPKLPKAKIPPNQMMFMSYGAAFSNNHQYTQYEIDGLIDFANRYITPESMRRVNNNDHDTNKRRRIRYNNDEDVIELGEGM